MRINFHYWLDLASRKIKNLNYFDGNLLIIIDGVDMIQDSDKGLEASLKFWLPRQLPERIKLVIGLSRNSNNMDYLK